MLRSYLLIGDFTATFRGASFFVERPPPPLSWIFEGERARSQKQALFCANSRILNYFFWPSRVKTFFRPVGSKRKYMIQMMIISLPKIDLDERLNFEAAADSSWGQVAKKKSLYCTFYSTLVKIFLRLYWRGKSSRLNFEVGATKGAMSDGWTNAPNKKSFKLTISKTKRKDSW